MPQHNVKVAIGASSASAAESIGLTNGDVPVLAPKTIAITDSTLDSPVEVLRLTHTTSGTAAAGIGAYLAFAAKSADGDTPIGVIGGTFSAVTSGAQTSAINLVPGYAGDPGGVGLRVSANVASIRNGVDFIPGATGVAPVIAAYGGDTNIGLTLKSKGTGSTVFSTPGGLAAFTVTSSGTFSILRSSDTTASPTVTTPAGIVRVQSGGATLTVTCSFVSATSLIYATIRNSTSNSVTLKSVVPGSGSFVVTLTGDPGASHADIAYLILN